MMDPSNSNSCTLSSQRAAPAARDASAFAAAAAPAPAAASYQTPQSRRHAVDPARFKKVPFRSGGIPPCGHDCCLGRSRGFIHSMKPANNRGPSSTSMSSGASGAQEWKGPCGVATTFFRLIEGESKSPVISFLAGFDKLRKKNSICSGTLADSWSIDAGCGVWGALREAREEFKIVFNDDKEFLEHVAFWFWSGNTLCFAIDLGLLKQPDDPRGSLREIQKRIAAAQQDPSLPSCEREISAMSEKNFPLLGTQSIRTKALEVEFSGFGLACMQVVLSTVQRIFATKMNAAIPLPASGAAAASSCSSSSAGSKAAAQAAQMIDKKEARDESPINRDAVRDEITK